MYKQLLKAAWILLMSLASARCGSPGISKPLPTEQPNTSHQNRRIGNQLDASKHPNYDNASPSCATGTLLTYKNFAKSFFSTYCLNCHSAQLTDQERGGAPVDINFDLLDEIKLRNQMIVKSLRTTSRNNMPPAQDLPPNIKRSILQWLYCGAPES